MRFVWFTVQLVFYGSGVYGMFCFMVLARKWPKLMRRWESIESKMPAYRTQMEKRQLAHHLKILAFVVLISSLGEEKNNFRYVEGSNYIFLFVVFVVEHVLNLVSIIHFSTTCLDPKEPIKEFFKIQLSQLFTFLPYSPIFAFLGKAVNIAATFTWNFRFGCIFVIYSTWMKCWFSWMKFQWPFCDDGEFGLINSI